MQNRSNYGILLDEIKLPERSSILIGELYHQRDRVITYLHQHNRIELGVCLSGEGIFIVENKILSFRQGDAVCIPPMAPHLAQSAPGTVSTWHWFYFDFETLLLPRFPEYDLSFFKRLSGERFRNILPGRDSGLASLLHQLLCSDRTPEIQSAWGLLIADAIRKHAPENGDGDDLSFDAGNFERISKALHYLSSRYRKKVKMAELERICGMSRAHFRRVFRQVTSRSPREYLECLRITMAKTELRRGVLPISEIARQCGYPTLSCFNRQFKAETGTSPSGYRAKTSSVLQN